MDAATIIKTLIQLGVSVKDIASKTSNGGKIDWDAVIKAVENDKDVKATLQSLLTALQGNDVKGAIAEIDKKQTALLAGRSVGSLPHDDLLQYSDLADARLVLATQQLTQALSGGVLHWLVDDALPTLVNIAPVVLKLLV